MKIICDQAKLINGLQIVSRAIPSKTTMSILEYILIDATGDSIRLIGNDMEIGIETFIEGEIAERGFIALNARYITDFVRKLDGDITIATGENEKVTITSGKAKFNIIGRSGEEFNYLPEIEKIDGVNISQYALKSVIQQTIFAIAGANDTNRMMSGELFEIKENQLKVVGLDGHRISIRKMELAESYGKKKVVIPGKTLQELSRILGDSTEEQVEIYFTDKHVMFAFGKTTVVSRLIEGEYFNIDQMLSSDYETKMTISRKKILDSLDRATLIVKEGDKKPVILSINDMVMELKINSTIASFSDDIEIEKQGKNLMIGFNPRFLIDALKAIDEENVDIYFVNPKAPCFIRNKEESYTYLILPINFTTVD
ncbi:MAG: DNA polymerase III subunit beta [Lachnospiraceae bacterium]|jgi:DNA polymerase-3 subunit beta|nr:DNA polymerase III subunit beta [Lachnospiraceae bacterium]